MKMRTIWKMMMMMASCWMIKMERQIPMHIMFRINPHSFLLCFQTNEDSTLSLSGLLQSKQAYKKSLLRYIFQTLLLHSFNLKLYLIFKINYVKWFRIKANIRFILRMVLVFLYRFYCM